MDVGVNFEGGDGINYGSAVEQQKTENTTKLTTTN